MRKLAGHKVIPGIFSFHLFWVDTTIGLQLLVTEGREGSAFLFPSVISSWYTLANKTKLLKQIVNLLQIVAFGWNFQQFLVLTKLLSSQISVKMKYTLHTQVFKDFSWNQIFPNTFLSVHFVKRKWGQIMS